VFGAAARKHVSERSESARAISEGNDYYVLPIRAQAELVLVGVDGELDRLCQFDLARISQAPGEQRSVARGDEHTGEEHPAALIPGSPTRKQIAKERAAAACLEDQLTAPVEPLAERPLAVGTLEEAVVLEPHIRMRRLPMPNTRAHLAHRRKCYAARASLPTMAVDCDTGA
jgi:hypothetical protein